MSYVHIHIFDKSQDGTGSRLYAAILESTSPRHKGCYHTCKDSECLMQAVLHFLLAVIQQNDYQSCRINLFSDEHTLNTLYPSGQVLEMLAVDDPELRYKNLWQKLVCEVQSRRLLLSFEPTRCFS